MCIRLLTFVALLFLASCSYPNVYRLLNLSDNPIQVHDIAKKDAWTLAAGRMSRRLQLSDGRRYELARPTEPTCRYRYPSLTAEGIPLPDGRRLVDGRSPRTVTLVTVDKDFVVRAYPYRDSSAVEPSSEFQSGGFPARPVRACTDDPS